MFLQGSRYRKARAFLRREGGKVVFEGIEPRPIGAAAGVVEHTVKAGDRLDLLARHYYNDGRLWWRIADANPELFHGADLVREKALDGNEAMVGRVILVPKAKE